MNTPPTNNQRRPNEAAELAVIMGVVVACVGIALVLYHGLQWLGFYGG